MKYDIVVIGGGAAGLAASRTALRHEATVAMVTEGEPGGDCTFFGCIPSKTLIAAAAAGQLFGAAMQRVRETVQAVATTESTEVLQREGIDVIRGRATLTGAHHLQVERGAASFKRLVVATGARPALPNVPGLDGADLLTNENVFELTTPPASLLVIGGGPIGIELGQAFARLGVEVTVIEGGERILPLEEPEASAVVTSALEADGVRVVTGRKVMSAKAHRDRTAVTLDDGHVVSASQVLAAVGRTPSTAGLGLEAAGVAVDSHGFVVADARLRTSVREVFAAGDVTGLSPFTHAADEMGRIAASNALSHVAYRRFRPERMPAVTYTSPEVARIGCTEGEAAAVHGARVAYVPLGEVDRAVTAGLTDGYVKLITAPRRGLGNLAGGRLIGATIVAPSAGEMLAGPAIALQAGMFPARLALGVLPYPTWSLGVRQAASQLFIESGGRRARPIRTA